MIPKLLSVIFLCLQVRRQKAHHFNDGIGISLPAFLVFNGEQMIHHLLYMPAILPHFQVLPRGIVFHYVCLKGTKIGIFADMCFYIGIDVSRAQHIKLKKKEKKISDLPFNLHQPMASGFDHPLWPVLKPMDGGADFMPTLMHWEFIPSYIRTTESLLHFRKGGFNPKTGKKDFPHNTLNAIGEEVLHKPTYKEAALKRRCLVLASGFYEWRHFTLPGGKDTAYPYYVTLQDKEYFFMAGIYNPWVDQESGEVVDSFAILTTAANPLMEQVHNKKKRMPVILPEAEAAAWLEENLDPERIQSLASFQLPSKEMETHTIRKDFRLIEEPREPFAYDELPALI